MEEEYDILYRGGELNPNVPVEWYSTSELYAKNWGKVKEHKIPLSILDNLAHEDIVKEEYKLDDNDEEFSLYDAECVNINAMKRDGYKGYFFYDDEYDCLNVCIFK